MDVNAVWFTGAVTPNGTERVAIGTGGLLYIAGDETVNTPPYIQFQELSTGFLARTYIDTLNDCFFIEAGSNDAILALFSGSGNACIGAIFDAGEKLFINGSIKAKFAILGQFRISSAPVADVNVSVEDSRLLFSNDGAGGDINYFLPPADADAIGTTFLFVVDQATLMTVTPTGAGPDEIVFGTNVLPAGDPLFSLVIGSTLRVVCTKLGRWVVVESMGSWSF